MDLHALVNDVIQIARQAGQIPRSHYTRPSTTDYKGIIDLVTDADRETEAFLVEALRNLAPEFGMIGEEGGSYAETDTPDYFWLIDPIDGTTNFAHRIPYFAVNICVATRDRRPVLGVTYNPMIDEMFSAVEGGGAFLNGQPIHVSETNELHRALTVTGFPYDRHTSPENNFAEFCAMSLKAQGVLRLGAASLDAAYVACGRLEAFWEQKLNPWDCWAGIILVREAGGLVTDYLGQEEGLRADRIRFLASNGHVHQQVQEVINNV